MRTALFALLVLAPVLAIGCGESSPPPPPTKVANQPLSAAVMRAMFTPGQACVRKYRDTMPASYVAQAHIARDRDGYLTLELRSSGYPAFDACMAEAIRAAHLQVDLANPVDVPLTFDFES
jgi:hypothetical protein